MGEGIVNGAPSSPLHSRFLSMIQRLARVHLGVRPSCCTEGPWAALNPSFPSSGRGVSAVKTFERKALRHHPNHIQVIVRKVSVCSLCLMRQEISVCYCLTVGIFSPKGQKTSFSLYTVKPAYMVHGCKVSPLVWSIFGWSQSYNSYTN